GGFGLSSAQANSESYLPYEHAIAESAPMGMAFQGNAPQTPGSLAQTALPDNPHPTTGGLNLPSSPLDPLIKAGALNGSVQARWSNTLGPCVGTIADASTSIGSLSMLNVLPDLSGLTPTDLSKILDPSKLTGLTQQQIQQLGKTPVPTNLLTSLIPGIGTGTSSGGGSVFDLPKALSSHSTVKLVDIPGSKNKAVQSTSTIQVAGLKLFTKTPFEIDINVVSQPTLVVTSTGDKKTSSVKYTAPVLNVTQGGKSLFTLDAAHPTQNIPIGIALPSQVTSAASSIPVIGGLLQSGQPVGSLQTVDLAALKLSIAELNQNGQQLTAGQNGAPFTGYQIGATARMLDAQILPTDKLNIPNLPSALAQLSLGEQVGRAYAPTGGVVCGTTKPAPAAPVANKPKPQASPKPLAYTDAYKAVPMFWTGTGLLLAGVILVAALPRRRVVASQRKK
ncbi:MAG: hypothetical protein J2O49_11020, partial [Sciscionella sp.]|nr:hypothetical protein [Sciscionella sp.]